uniref:Uncharacterized protein n=1 Tax=Megaselia scalaris TaxID=36166 RepID=T1GCL6_MEGSC
MFNKSNLIGRSSDNVSNPSCVWNMLQNGSKAWTMKASDDTFFFRKNNPLNNPLFYLRKRVVENEVQPRPKQL